MIIPRKETEVELEVEIDVATIDISIARVAATKAAADRLVKNSVTVYHAELKAEIKFTKKGIKECVNQPFQDFREKLKLIYEGLEEALRNSKYDGCPEPRDPDHGKSHVVSYHYFETSVAGKPAFFNVQLTNQGEYVLYTITDHLRSKKNSAQRA